MSERANELTTGGPTPRYLTGARAGLPVAVPIFVLGVSFGVLARSLGWGVIAPTMMSALVFSGSAQFALAAVLASGGSAVAGVAAAALVNARFLPMGIAVAGSLAGGRLQRAIEGQAVVDAGWALAHRGDGTFDRRLLIGFFVTMIPAWVGGTLFGAAVGARLGDIDSWGIDVVFPAFFVALLAEEVKDRTTLLVAGCGAAIALLTLPWLPAGLPVILASGAALVGLRRTRKAGQA